MIRFLAILLLLVNWSVLAKDYKWKKIYKKHRLTFYKQKTKKSELLKFRATGEIKVSTEEILAILRDVERTTKWDKNTTKKITVTNHSDIEATTYSITHIPWPFDNRDMVLNNKLFLSKDKQYLYVIAKSVKHKKYKKNKKYVRAKLLVEMRVRPKDQNWSYVDLIIEVDPKGSIPKWLVNLVQQDMPLDFLKSLEKYSKKVEMKPLPGVVKLYDELISNLAIKGNPGSFKVGK